MLTFSHNELLEQPVAMKRSLFVILALALLNSACSTVGLVYRNADWYLLHKINGYTTFNAGQRETIRREVSDYMQWHRKNALPEYIIFLQNLNGVAQYGGRSGAEDIARLRSHLLGLYRTTLVPAIRPTALLLSNLDSRQISELGRNLARENRERKREILDGSHDEILDKRADKTIDFLEWLAGSLDNEQEKKIRELSRQLPFVSHIFIQNREANQGRLIALLNDRAGEEKIAAFLSSWILTPEASRTPQQQRDMRSFETATDEMIVKIHGLLTTRQKDHLRKRIISYIDEMQSLATDAHDASGTSR